MSGGLELAVGHRGLLSRGVELKFEVRSSKFKGLKISRERERAMCAAKASTLN